MYRMAYRWTLHPAEAEDLVQDVLVSLVPRVARLETVEKLGPWLIKVLYHRFVDLYHRRSISPLDQSVSWNDDDCDLAYFTAETRDESPEQELRCALNSALMALDPGWRHVVLLHDVEGYTAIEVAEILDLNVGTVKSRLHRAHRKLKKILESGTVAVPQAC
jgi:RNA polymerase sigma-70 factor (ECF subfamily)